MRVAVLSAEAVPYSKTGGLGDVAGALPKALRRIGEDAFLITPFYKQTKENLIDHLAIDFDGTGHPPYERGQQGQTDEEAADDPRQRSTVSPP